MRDESKTKIKKIFNISWGNVYILMHKFRSFAQWAGEPQSTFLDSAGMCVVSSAGSRVWVGELAP